ncbi:hypothetical protein SAMN05216203_1190 [Marinobacter daqiaonensis]|uniref:Uncharacterized protein n=1 Tax=Marinobacter daqiaonensis TaxID=650891 RepID=A0A1I6HFK8_9GAMM|nr:hypothetical protein [Marinobacter daqiaonensis]SFR53148.1 hypothetical protein SAMN05216203_1190 [Marinobacter daqiaonensis]
MQDFNRVSPVPSTLFHNGAELRRVYTRVAARHATKAAARWMRQVQHRINGRIWPDQPAAG